MINSGFLSNALVMFWYIATYNCTVYIVFYKPDNDPSDEGDEVVSWSFHDWWMSARYFSIQETGNPYNG